MIAAAARFVGRFVARKSARRIFLRKFWPPFKIVAAESGGIGAVGGHLVTFPDLFASVQVKFLKLRQF